LTAPTLASVALAMQVGVPPTPAPQPVRVAPTVTASTQLQGFQSTDLSRFRSIGQVALSPDGGHVAYTVTSRDRPGRPNSQLWIMDLATAKAQRVGDEKSSQSLPHWSPDGRWLAYDGNDGTQSGLWVARADGSEPTFLCRETDPNLPLPGWLGHELLVVRDPGQGDNVLWSPNSTQIAFIRAIPGTQPDDSASDPGVVSHYLYRPTIGAGASRFNDNRRLELFVVDVGTKAIRQLTNGTRDVHSITWSPDGKDIVFVANYEPNSDEFFHYDLFAIRVDDGAVRRLTATEGTKYAPAWSPDGRWIAYLATTRGLTDRESPTEDAHVWIMDADGAHLRDVGQVVVGRESRPQWSRDGSGVFFTVQQHGSVHLVLLPIAPTGLPGHAEIVVNDPGAVTAFSPGRGGAAAYALTTPSDLAELYVTTARGAPRKLTDLNADLLAARRIASVDSFSFVSNDNRLQVQAFLVKPLNVAGRRDDTIPATKYPLIVDLHAEPHGQGGPAFTFQDQVYAAHGWATLHVNYRGSSGAGQQFADAAFGDQDGDEAQDVLYAVSAAVRRNLWIDRERMGLEGVGYGGQLTNWLVTQTNEFKAAISIDGASNLISYNYTTYYDAYEEMAFGEFLSQGTTLDEAWRRSPIRFVAQVHTPVMLIHGDSDPIVPIEEAEQYYIALRDVGVETVMVHYPREAHILAETRHIIDQIDRKVAWYERHFVRPDPTIITNVQP
jgi:dipeptidyl aminopeptidase/acylaminoacyl peptidase